MKSRFPGMDPYLESPGIWPGFHEAFLSYTREALQPVLPDRYYAELQTREEVGIAGYDADRVIYPNVAVGERPVVRDDSRPQDTGTGKPAQPEHLVIAEEEPVRVSYLEIREAVHGGRLITLIELLSPTNKITGDDREAFERKQREILQSDANRVEIDLLRRGRRLGCHPRVDLHCRSRGYDYVVVVSRSTRRSPKLDLEIFGFGMRDPLPVIPVPLRDPDPDVALDLGAVFIRAYETGPYHKILRYDRLPDPPVSDEDAEWARSVVDGKS